METYVILRRAGWRSGEELQEAAARHAVDPLRRAFGEFAVHHLAKFGRLSHGFGGLLRWGDDPGQ